MKASYCTFCRNEFIDNSIDGKEKFCSKKCEARSKRAVWTTMSILHTTRNKLIVLQNDILGKINYKVPYTKLIDHILYIATKCLGKVKLSDRIINDFNYNT